MSRQPPTWCNHPRASSGTYEVVQCTIAKAIPAPHQRTGEQIVAVRIHLASFREGQFNDRDGDSLLTKEVPGRRKPQDYLWAAEYFCRGIIPHVLAGKKKRELPTSSCLSRLPSAAWELYLGHGIPSVSIDHQGKLELSDGRHRTLAAIYKGLQAIPMRTSTQYNCHDGFLIER